MKTFGIIGGGTIAYFHAKAIQAMHGGRLGAVFARNPDKAKSFAKQFCSVFVKIVYCV